MVHALGADAEAADLRADRRDRGGADDVAARAARRRRNWDYRYTWIRDAAFSLYALLRLGFTEEAAAFMNWLTDRTREWKTAPSGPLQIMYGIDGRAELPEFEHPTWRATAARTRCGSATPRPSQLQLDIYGELIDSVYLYNKYGSPIFSDTWDNVRRIVDWLCENWDQADEGIWETRGGQKDFTYSRLMCWVALERSIRMNRARGLPGDIVRWLAERDRIYNQIMQKGWSNERQAFVQHYGSDVLDASVLLMPLTLFIAPEATRNGCRRSTRSATSSSPTRWSTATTSRPRRTACAATRARSRSARSGTSRRSRAPGGWTRRGWRSRRCSPTPTTSGSTPRRSARPARRSATSRRRSPTWR